MWSSAVQLQTKLWQQEGPGTGGYVQLADWTFCGWAIEKKKKYNQPATTHSHSRRNENALAGCQFGHRSAPMKQSRVFILLQSHSQTPPLPSASPPPLHSPEALAPQSSWRNVLLNVSPSRASGCRFFPPLLPSCAVRNAIFPIRKMPLDAP